MAEKAYQKIPGTGPANQAIGNACFFVFADSQNLEAVSILSRLKLKLKQTSVIKLINGYIHTIADKLGLTIHEMEDLSVPDFWKKFLPGESFLCNRK